MTINSGIQEALQNWIPYHLFWQDQQPYCRWLFTGDKEFTEPFFDETLEKCKHFPHNSRPDRCISHISMLPEWAQHIENIQPTAFIFHVSRCGSTLATQLLGLSRANIILSEVPFFDELLRWKKTPITTHETSELLSSSIVFYAAKRQPEQERLFIKTDSWHILFYQQIRSLFPDTPIILLYRQPAEVIRSHQKRRGMQAVPGLIEPALFGFSHNDLLNVSLDEYMALVLEKYFERFLDIAEKDPLSFPVNYNEGPLAVVEKIASAAGFSITEREMNDMKQRINYHAKYPGQIFVEETDPSSIPVYLNKATELYDTLEEIRRSITSYSQG